jgi:hypothetical protein
MLPAVFSRKEFDAILRAMSDEDAATFAATNRTTFASCFTLAAPGTAAPSEPAKPPLAKAKASTPSAPKADRTMLLASVESVMATHPKKTAPEYTELLASIAGDDPKFGIKVRRACEALVTAGKAVFDGEHRNRRYWPTPRGNAQEPEQAE